MSIIKDILNTKPVIETERTRIYPFKLESKVLADLHEIYRDAENVQYYSATYSNPMMFAHYMIDKIHVHQKTMQYFISFIIEHKGSSKIIGLRNFIQDGRYTKSGINETLNKPYFITEAVLNKKYWNKGLGIETSQALYDFMSTKGAYYLLTFIHPNNYVAQKLGKRMGFVKTDIHEVIERYGFDKDCTINATDDVTLAQPYVKTLPI